MSYTDRVPYQGKDARVFVQRPPKQIKCDCHNGGKVLHFFERVGVRGDVYSCSSCGQEKTIK